MYKHVNIVFQVNDWGQPNAGEIYMSELTNVDDLEILQEILKLVEEAKYTHGDEDINECTWIIVSDHSFKITEDKVDLDEDITSPIFVFTLDRGTYEGYYYDDGISADDAEDLQVYSIVYGIPKDARVLDIDDLSLTLDHARMAKVAGTKRIRLTDI